MHLNPASLRRTLSLVLAGSLLLTVLFVGMLPGLLAIAFSYVASNGIQSLLKLKDNKYVAKPIAFLVALIPWVAGFIFFKLAQDSIPALHRELQGLSHSLENFIITKYVELPESVAQFLPEFSHLNEAMANFIKSQMGAVAHFSKNSLGILLQIIVGFIIGPMIFLSGLKQSPKGVLESEITKRAKNFGDTFKAIVLAQFFIAIVNTVATFIYLFAILPPFGIELPFKTALLVITFVASLIPIAGNIFCNTLLTVVSLTVSPGAALAALTFLVLVHKSEYFISATVLGERTHIKVWELLIVIFMSEALFGLYGILAGPLYYAYLRKELTGEVPALPAHN